jgi:hypothetical protein
VFPKFATSVTVADFGDRGRVVAEMVWVTARRCLRATTVSQRLVKMLGMDDDRATTYDFSMHHTKTVHDYYRGVSGTRLRHAALAILMSVRSCTLAEM